MTMSIENNIKKMVDLMESMNAKMDKLIEGQGKLDPMEQSASIEAEVPRMQPEVLDPPAPAPQAPMPAPSPVSQTEPAPAEPSANTCPFNDNQGLVQYIMGAYQQLGPQKGAGIQSIMSEMGINNINDTKPEQYQALYDGVEKLLRG